MANNVLLCFASFRFLKLGTPPDCMYCMSCLVVCVFARSVAGGKELGDGGGKGGRRRWLEGRTGEAGVQHDAGGRQHTGWPSRASLFCWFVFFCFFSHRGLTELAKCHITIQDVSTTRVLGDDPTRKKHTGQGNGLVSPTRAGTQVRWFFVVW